MNAFSVSYERVNDSEAMHGGTTRHGMIEDGLSLADAVRTLRNERSSAREDRGAYASDADPRAAHWISTESEEWETGDSLTLAIHFPQSATPSSRARLVRLLQKVIA